MQLIFDWRNTRQILPNIFYRHGHWNCSNMLVCCWCDYQQIIFTVYFSWEPRAWRGKNGQDSESLDEAQLRLRVTRAAVCPIWPVNMGAEMKNKWCRHCSHKQLVSWLFNKVLLACFLVHYSTLRLTLSLDLHHYVKWWHGILDPDVHTLFLWPRISDPYSTVGERGGLAHLTLKLFLSWGGTLAGHQSVSDRCTAVVVWLAARALWWWWWWH